MISIFNCLLFIAFATTLSASSDFSLKGDPCAQNDRCQSKSVLKTCSCDKDCYAYGTCCHDKTSSHDIPGYQCYDRRTASPVFAKRSCSEAFRGHVGDRLGCVDGDDDEMDVKNNLLMTSRTTKVTYWNKHCASCNNEAKADLDYWNIEVFCPKHEEISRYAIRRNLTLDPDKGQWGLMIGEEFLSCAVRYAPPIYVNEVKHCTPNMITTCPEDYNNTQISTKCSQYYAERKVKNSDLHFKNIHCAICNNADIKELECPGMSTPEESVEESDFQDMVEEIFTDGEWVEKRFQCSRGFIYDPTREKCRHATIEVETTTVQNSADGYGKKYFVFMVVLLAFAF